MPVILIVDDNGKNRKLAREVLGAAGFRTLEAETASDGIALAASHVPDVILMDLRLPDLNGADAARALARDERTARIPVVAMSALPIDDHGWLASAGFAGSLEKPIRVESFPEQVRRFCTEPSR